MNSQMNRTEGGAGNLTDEARDLLNATAGVAGEKVEEARNRLTKSLASAKEVFVLVQNKAVEGAKATDKVVRDHPYHAIGVAFGLGALVGYLLNRRD